MIVPCNACKAPNRIPAERLTDRAHCAACKADLVPLTHPVNVTSVEEFDELVNGSTVPVLVDFWAAWCGPCRMVGPELEKFAERRAGQVVIAKVDTEALPQLAERFRGTSSPLLILMKDGQLAGANGGAVRADMSEHVFGRGARDEHTQGHGAGPPARCVAW